METHSELLLGDQDVRHLWTRFEGLVGNQLYRLRVDGKPVPVGSPSRGPSSGGLLPAATRSSSMCSLITSEQSSISMNSSPARLQEVGPGLSLGSDGCGRDRGGGGGGLGRGTSVDTGVSDGGPRVRMEDDGDVGDDEDGGGDVDGGERDEEADGGCGDGSLLGTSTSCCLLPSEESCSGRSSSNGRGQMMRRNASSNALNTSDTQPLFGLPYVARAAGPLLSLTTVTLEEWTGQEGPHCGDSLIKLEERRLDSGRSMLGVYKQSLVLESQLHQYLNPGLVTSLNRRVARATFEAEAMVSLIDKLRKESKKAATDTDRMRNVVEVSTKLKSLLGRQKCEWQCVGRLKETLTMAREMKELLKFIARLSNLLERSKLSLGNLQDRPPPYEYCSPYSDIRKTGWPGGESLPMLASSENQSFASPEAGGDIGSPVRPKNLGHSDNKSNIVLSSKASASCHEVCDGEGAKVSPMPKGRPPSRPPSPQKFTRSPRKERCCSSDSELDQQPAREETNKRLKSSGTGEKASPNVNVSNSVEEGFIKHKDSGDPLPWLTAPMVVNTVYEAERSQGMRYMKSPLRVPPGSQDVVNEMAQVISKMPIQECSGLECQLPCVKADGECAWRRAVKNGSPPRACPKKRDSERSDCYCRSKKSSMCSPRKGVSLSRPRNSPRWDNGSSRSRRKMSDVEGEYIESAPDNTSPYNSSDSETGMDTSANSRDRQSSKAAMSNKNSKASVGKDSLQIKGSPSPRHSPRQSSRKETSSPELNENTSAEPENKKNAASPVGAGSASQLGKGGSTSQSGKGGSMSQSGKGGSTSQSGKGGTIPLSGKGSPKGKGSKGGDYDSGDSEENSGSSNSSGDILIDIQQDYPNKDKTKAPSSVPPNGCGHRRIRVRVKRSVSTSNTSKRRRSRSRSKSRSDTSRPKSPRKSTSQKLSDRETSDEAEAMEDDQNLKSADEDEDNVLSARESHLGEAESQLLAQGTPKSGTSPKPSRKGSSAQGTASKITAATSRDGSQVVVEYESDGGPEEEPPQDWRSSLANSLRHSQIPGADKVADIFDEPWKLGAAGLLLLIVLYTIFSWLFRSCCGCGYLPNPFFFLTNSLAGRVTLRHGGLAPT